MENTIGTKLQQLIKEHEQTNAKAAEAIGVSASLISDIINGKKKQGIGADIVKKICEHYHVSSDWLLGITPCSDERKDFEAVFNVTGLSVQSIANLKTIKGRSEQSGWGTKLLIAIDMIISNCNLETLVRQHTLIDALCDYLDNKSIWLTDKAIYGLAEVDYSIDDNGNTEKKLRRLIERAEDLAEKELIDAINMQKLQAELVKFRNNNFQEYKRRLAVADDEAQKQWDGYERDYEVYLEECWENYKVLTQYEQQIKAREEQEVYERFQNEYRQFIEKCRNGYEEYRQNQEYKQQNRNKQDENK